MPTEEDISLGLAETLIRLSDRPEDVEAIHRFLDRWSHRVRNQLNAMKLGLYLARRSWAAEQGLGQLDEVERCYARLEKLVEHLHQFFRKMDGTMLEAPMASFLEARCRFWQDRWSKSGRRIHLTQLFPRPTAMVRISSKSLTEALDTFADWRRSELPPGTDVRISWTTQDDQHLVEWEEYPPEGEAQADRAAEGVLCGLAQPLLARVLCGHGGRLERSCDRKFKLWLPICEATPTPTITEVSGPRDIERVARV